MLNERDLKCLDLILLDDKGYPLIIKIPSKLGNFVKDICGNSLSIAAWILQVQSEKYDRIYEASEYGKIIETLFLLKGLIIFINNSMQNPDKHFTDTFSKNKEWEFIHKFYNYNKKTHSINWCIQGQFRYKNIPYPKGKRLKKELLNGRCMLCHQRHAEHTYFCQDHVADDSTTSNKNKVKRWIRDSYNFINRENYKSSSENLDIFVKSYEVHTWAKWHPIHMFFRQSLLNKAKSLYENIPDLSYKSNATRISKELEELYLKHPYIDEFECAVDCSSGEILDVLYSLILQSEHTIIKVSASKRLRDKYNFSDIINKGWIVAHSI